ncbi:MAG: glycosyltransferase [Candidatus Bathyarchaeota archaeon]|nr:glycosyltransferase [Candidatus Bathyarchaeota archaeon]
MRSVSVIISVYSIERANDVMDCIASLKQQTLPPKEIILVLDPQASLVSYYKKRLDSSVKLVVSDAFGLSAARNAGIKNTDSEFVAFIDDDATADKSWLQNLINNFEYPSVIGVGGKILPVWPSKNPVWFPEELYWVVGCSYKGLPTQKAPIRNPIGCNMAFRRSMFEKVGYFSTETGRVGNKLMGHDDTEIGIRATNKLHGTSILYDPTAVVYHRVSANRVSVNYVLKRSYSEGFSKAFISSSSQTKIALGAEKTYLHNLFLGSSKMLLQGNIRTGPSRCWTLWVATVMVFLGYIVGKTY